MSPHQSERNEAIGDMWQENKLTASQIANEFGITKGAVMGVIHRLRASGRNLDRRSDEKKLVVYQDFKSEPAPSNTGVTIMGLTSRSCRYILGDIDGEHTIYCGEPIDGRSWCAKHRKLCYYYANNAPVKPTSAAHNPAGESVSSRPY
jgi:hypothetical protein